MPEMTEEEAFALDELYTKTTPKLRKGMVWFVVKFFSSFPLKTIPFHAIFETWSWNLFLCRLLSNMVLRKMIFVMLIKP